MKDAHTTGIENDLYPDKIKKINGCSNTHSGFTNAEVLEVVADYIDAGLPVLPCEDKRPVKRIKNVNRLRQHPFNSHNYKAFFDGAPQVAVLTGAKIECIDVDSKYDLTGRLNQQLLTAIKYTLPEVYAKLVIESTPTGGKHLYYRCHQIGGNQQFAKRHATAKEKEKGERFKTLIETRGEGGLIVCFPSPGYILEQGDLTELQFITPEERQELIAICRSFNLVDETILKGLTRKQANLPEAPWNVFNRQHDYKWMASALQDAGYEIVNDDADRVYVLRPGSSAKTSGAIWKESNILYLFSTSTEFEAETPISAFSMYCAMKFDGDVKAAARHLSEQGIGSWKADESEFYSINDKNKVEIKLSAIEEWMSDVGLRKFWYCDTDFEIVQVIDNIVQIITLDRIKKIFGTYIKETVPERIYNVFLSSIRALFTKEGIITQLENLERERFIKSDVNTAWVFYKNGALTVTSSNCSLVSYSSLEGYVWKTNILDRDYRVGVIKGDAKEFIWLLSGQRENVERMFICAFGYLLHNYKDPVNPKVIIFNDEFYDENGTEPQGGTGKGLSIQMLHHCRNVYSVDGKSFRLDKSFAFQGISEDTELFVIEDVPKGFDFERMFSIVTDGITIEKKGKDEFKIPYEQSPKILITSNYAIKGSSSSHLRRRYELEVASYFSNKYTPIDHFKRRLFIDWSTEDWYDFDNYMIHCLQTYLSIGLPKEVNINLKKKKLIQETHRDFINWIEQVHQDGIPAEKVAKEAFKERFTNLYPDFANKLTTAKFTQWLVRWGEDFGVNVDASNKYNGVMVYQFKGQLKATAPYELLENQKFVNDTEKFVSIPDNLKSSWYSNTYLDSLADDEYPF